MKLDLLEERYSVALLDPGDLIPEWIQGPGIRSTTYSESELSIVCPQNRVPDGIQHEPGWCALRIQGPLAFDQVGILYRLLEPLANAQVPVFVLSTFLTDYLFIQDKYLPSATHVLQEAGHIIQAMKNT